MSPTRPGEPDLSRRAGQGPARSSPKRRIDIDYVGATAVELIGPGESAGQLPRGRNLRGRRRSRRSSTAETRDLPDKSRRARAAFAIRSGPAPRPQGQRTAAKRIRSSPVTDDSAPGATLGRMIVVEDVHKHFGGFRAVDNGAPMTDRTERLNHRAYRSQWGRKNHAFQRDRRRSSTHLGARDHGMARTSLACPRTRCFTRGSCAPSRSPMNSPR